ncbi:MAG: DUF2892 domain-containing protein [Anaerolineaceae bacterium]|nr:DUF2892 domain-containing protein [Anaerolineaceae bacterium]
MSFVNESGVDRIIRAVVGIVLLALGWTGAVSGVLGIILMVVGAILLVTGVVGFCPLYRLFNIRTNKG